MHFGASGRALVLFSALMAAAPVAWAQSDPIDEIEESITDDEPADPPPAAEEEVEEEEEPAPEPEEEPLPEGELEEEEEPVTPPPAAPPSKAPAPKPPPPEEEEDAPAKAPKDAPDSPQLPDVEPKKVFIPKRTLKPLPVPEVPALPPVPTEADLIRHIEKRAELVRLGDRAGADVELAYLHDTRRKLGSGNVIVASAALINEARLAMEAQEHERAIELVEAAAELSPDLVSAHWMRARVYFQIDWTQISAISRALSDLVAAQLWQFRNLLSLVSRFLMLFGLAVLGTFVAFVVLQAIKYLRYPAHDFASLWPGFMGTGEMVLVLLILLSLPLVLGLGIGLACAVTLALVYAYQTRRERAVSTAIMVSFAIGPGLVYLAAPLVTFHGSITDAMATAVSEAFASDAEQRLRYYAEHEGKDDHETFMVLAHLKRRRGDLPGAEADYGQALASHPQSAFARNNLGTILYLMGRKEAAAAAFKQAATREIAEPYLNLASISAEAGEFDTAKNYLEQARAIDSELTDRYTRLDSSVHTSERLLEARFDQGILWRRLFDADAAQSAEVTEQVWRSVTGWLPPAISSIVMAALLALGLALLKRADRLSAPCPKCGIPADRGSPARYCGQCNSVFLTAVAVEPSLRRRKEFEVRRFQVRRRWVERALTLFAGSPQVYSGQPVAGMFLMFFFLLLVGNMFMADYLSVHPWSVWVDSSAAFVWSVACGGLAVVLVLISIRMVANQR
jgi:Tfp pilus assembly protein PilF